MCISWLQSSQLTFVPRVTWYCSEEPEVKFMSQIIYESSFKDYFFFKLKSELVFENQVIKGTKQHMVAYTW